jgi:outer membrane receptor protein involved in Fe transport
MNRFRIWGTVLFIYMGMLASGLSQTEQYAQINGTVSDSLTGELLPGANVYLKSDLTVGTSTDESGKFTFLLEPGIHILVVSYTGMENKKIALNLQPNERISLAVQLNTLKYDFDEVVISAGKYERRIEQMMVSTEVVSQAVIEARNTVSIETALNQVPGVNIIDEEPQIRGGSGFTFGVGSKVGIYLDQMPLITATAGRPNWGLVPVENIKQVEVVKGPSSVLTGSSAMSGAMYFRTEYVNDNKPRTKIRAYSGMYTAPQNPEQKWWDGISYLGGLNFLHAQKLDSAQNSDLVVSGMFHYERGYQGAPKPGIYALGNNDISDSDIQTRQGRVNLNFRRQSTKIKGLSVGINGSLMAEESPLIMAWFDDTTGFYRGYPGASFLTDQVIFYLDPFIDLINALGSHHHFSMRIMNDNSAMTNNQSVLTTSIFGLYEYRKKFLEIKDLELIFGVSGQGTYSTADMFSSSGSPENDALNVSIYAEFEKAFGSSLRFNVGVRGEYFDINGTDSYTKPLLRSSLNLKLMQESYLRLSFGQGYRFPTIAERYIRTNLGSFAVFDNPDLVPESGWNAEIGIKQGFKFLKFYGYLDAAAFLQEYDNTVEYLFGFWDPTYDFAIAGFKFVNTGKSRVTGVDVSLTGQSKWNKHNEFIFSGGYTYILPVTLQPDLVFAEDYRPGGDGQFSYETTSVFPDDRILKYRFRHTFKMDAEYRWKGLFMGASFRYFSRMENVDQAIFDFEDFTSQIGGGFPPVLYSDYFFNNNNGQPIFDTRIGITIAEKHRVSLISNNVFNRTYSLRPLKADPMRSILIQYVGDF